MLVALKALGTEGSGGSNLALRDVFGTGRGTNTNYIRRVAKALRNLRQDYAKWPDTRERKAIARQIEDLCNLPNCVGLIDGTLLPLACHPLLHGENLSRKRFYAIVMLVVCDDQGCILYYHVGWPGLVHDN